MSDIGPDRFRGLREFREERLASLADSLGAFGARYADGVDAGEQHWPARLTDVPFTVVARSDGEPVCGACGEQSEDVVELISMWVAPSQRGTCLAGQLGGHDVQSAVPIRALRSSLQRPWMTGGGLTHSGPV